MILWWNEDYSLFCSGMCFILWVFKNIKCSLQNNLLNCYSFVEINYTDNCMMFIWLCSALFLWKKLPFSWKIVPKLGQCILYQSFVVHTCHSLCISFKLIFGFTLSQLTEFPLLLYMCELLRLMMGLLTDMLTLSISQVSGSSYN